MQKYSKLNVQCYKSLPLDDITCLSRYTIVKGFRNKDYYYEKVEMMRGYAYKHLVWKTSYVIDLSYVRVLPLISYDDYMIEITINKRQLCGTYKFWCSLYLISASHFFQFGAQHIEQCWDSPMWWFGPPYDNASETTLFDEIWIWEMDMKSLHGGWRIYHPGFTQMGTNIQSKYTWLSIALVGFC